MVLWFIFGILIRPKKAYILVALTLIVIVWFKVFGHTSGGICRNYIRQDIPGGMQNFTHSSVFPCHIKNTINWASYRIYNFTTKRLSPYLNDYQLALYTSIVLGKKHKLPENLYKKSKEKGILHVLVVSGYNLTVLSLFFEVFFKRFIKKYPLPIAVFISTSMLLIVGDQPPLLRAASTFLSLAISKQLRVKVSPYSITAVALIFLVLYDPLLIRDISFLLSITAYLTLLLASTNKNNLIRVFSPILVQLVMVGVVYLLFSDLTLKGVFYTIFITPFMDIFIVIAYLFSPLLLTKATTRLYAYLISPFLNLLMVVFWI